VPAHRIGAPAKQLDPKSCAWITTACVAPIEAERNHPSGVEFAWVSMVPSGSVAADDVHHL
jgi:hypothetical protein